MGIMVFTQELVAAAARAEEEPLAVELVRRRRLLGVDEHPAARVADECLKRFETPVLQPEDAVGDLA